MSRRPGIGWRPRWSTTHDAALTMEKNFHHLASPVIRKDIL